MGIRLNRSPPNITLTRKKTGGIHVSKSPSVTLTHVDEQMVKRILAVRTADLSYVAYRGVNAGSDRSSGESPTGTAA